MEAPRSEELKAYHEHPGLDRAMDADHSSRSYWVEFIHSHSLFVFVDDEDSDQEPAYQKRTGVLHSHGNLNI